MKTYLLLVESQGAFAQLNFRIDNWQTTENPAQALAVEARDAEFAINKFCKMLGITIRYRGAKGSITDRNLHSFTARDMAAVQVEESGVEA